MKTKALSLLLLLVLAALGGSGVGCRSPESENLSSRPWNAPRGFDTGLPGYDMYQRR